MIGEQDAAGAAVLAGVQQVVQFGPTLGDTQFQALFEAVLIIAGGEPDVFAGEVHTDAGDNLYEFYWVRRGGFGSVMVARPSDQQSPLAISGWVRPLSSLVAAHVEVITTGGRVVREDLHLRRKVRLRWTDDRDGDGHVVLDASSSTNEANRERLERLIDAVLDRAYS